MTSMDNRLKQSAELRNRAEKILQEKLVQSPEHVKAKSLDELRQILHDLQVHQIELEMQNEELRQAHVELDVVRDRYFNLYDLAPVGYCTISTDGLILEANLTVAAMLGVARSKLANQHFNQFLHKDDQDAFYLHCRQLYENGKHLVCELRMLHQNGKVCWARLEANLTYDADSEPVCRVVLSDITERKSSEAALSKSEEKLRAIFNNTDVGVLFTAPDGRIFSANEAACKLLERSEQELCHGGRDLVVDISDPRLPQVLEDRMRTGRFQGGLNFKRRDGTLFPVELSSTIFPYGNNELRSCILFRDITKSKQAEELLGENEEKYRAFFFNAATGSAEISLDGRFIQVNERLCTFTGYSSEELLCMTPSDLTHPDDRELNDRGLAAYLAGESHVYQADKRYIRKDGQIIWVHVSAAMVHDTNGNPLRSVGIILDITERKKAEITLQHKQAMLARTEKIAQVGSWEWDIATDTVECSDELFHIFQLEPSECPNSFAEQSKLYHPEDIERLRKVVDTAKNNGTAYEIELRVIRKDGSTRICLARGQLEVDQSGGVTRLVGSLQDITMHKQAENELRERTLELEKTNATLSMMLDYARKTESEIQERVVSNLRSNILGILEIVKKEQLTKNAQDLVELLESTTRNLAHPIARSLESQLVKLTPRELQLANFIRLGKSTKELMVLLNVTVKTVEAHRTSLRKKLGIHRKKINLRTFLTSEFSV